MECLLRQSSPKLASILENFRGDSNALRVYRMQEASNVPKDMILILEHSDDYSLQVSRPMTLADFNNALTEYLRSLQSMSTEEFIEFYNDIDDQDN
jgi:hypothetical protein